MRPFRIAVLTALVVALLAVTAYGAGYASRHLGNDRDREVAPHGTAPDPESPSDESPTAAPPSAQPTPTTPSARPTPVKPTLEPGPRIHGPGDHGEEIRDLQARLKQIAWLSGEVTGTYDAATTTAVRGFQKKREIPVTGEVDKRTLNRLYAMTRVPSHAEKHNIAPPSATTGAPLDARCRTGRALCVDKSSRTVRWVVDGKVRQTLEVRFGSSSTPTREGAFTVNSKSRDHVSSLYDTEMPFAMFFSGGQAVHYSPDFAARGYSGASHGCVNVRDRAGISWLFDQVSIGDKVVVYWS